MSAYYRLSSDDEAQDSDRLLPSPTLDEKSGATNPKVRGLEINARAAQLLSPGDILFTPRTPRTPLLLNSEPSLLQEASTKKRTLKWSSAYILIISRVVGSGIFAAPGVIAQSTGSVGLALVLWLVGAVVAACGLTVSMELGCMLPRNGGENVYLEFIYDRPRFLASTIIAVQAMLLGFTASNCVVFGKYILFSFGITEASDAAQRMCAAGLIIIVTIIHGRWLKGGIMLQNILGWIKVAVIAFIGIAGLSVLVARPPNLDHWQQQSLSISTLFEGSQWNFGTIATSFFKVSYAYSGYDNVNNVLDEVKDPVRTLKSAAPAAMISIFIFYLLLNVAYFLVVPLEEVKSSGELVAALFFERLFGDGFGSRVLPILIALSAAGNVMVTTFAQARVNQEIARQGFLPFSRTLAGSSRWGTPLGGLAMHLVPSLTVILLPPQGAIYSFILELKGYPAQMTSLAVCAGLLWLRSRRPDLRRPFKAYRLAVYLPIGLNIALLAAPFFPPAEGREEYSLWYGTYAVVGISTVVIAVLYWYIWIHLLPRLWRYDIDVMQEELDDGTIINKLIRVPKDIKYKEVTQ
ncbi:methionine permease [Microthyrium microscopicum]|uniref:Methionine permease n=1 Tax=Microthyrium microscopicum TaxID=703497 RepID=A0A6A6UQM8_9PEZI|nr:methionine permease [Microthyrium microscopicum]